MGWIKKVLRPFLNVIPIEYKLWCRQQIFYRPKLFKKKYQITHESIDSLYPSLIAKPNLLEELGEKYQPTKRLHNYLQYYWMHFRDIRLKVRKVLEIGVETDRSIRMWEEFFPNATIYGLDIDERCKMFEGERRRIFIGDQNDKIFLEDVIVQAGGYFDIVIDDGSHFVRHQLKTFDTLFPFLSSHGTYVLEDTGGCVGDTNLNSVTAMKELIDHIMYFPKNYKFSEWSSLSQFPTGTLWIDRNIVGIAFYRWIVFVMRGRNPQDNPYLLREAYSK